MEMTCTRSLTLSQSRYSKSQWCNKKTYFLLPSQLQLFCVSLLVCCLIGTAITQDNNDDYRDPDQEQDALLHSSSRGASQIVSPVYDPQARDFTARCLKLAQYSGPKACEVFMVCCSEDNVLNKLNGDRCQRADSTNGCTPNFQGDGVQWSQCKAFNCTEEITTTTSTTLAPPSASSPTISRIYALMTLSTSSFLLILPLLI